MNLQLSLAIHMNATLPGRRARTEAFASERAALANAEQIIDDQQAALANAEQIIENLREQLEDCTCKCECEEGFGEEAGGVNRCRRSCINVIRSA